MRVVPLFAAACLLGVSLAPVAAGARSLPPISATIKAALAAVQSHDKARAMPGYPDALLALAKAYRAASQLAPAHAAAERAAAAYDSQLEMHHALSEALADPIHGRAERAEARRLGLARDAARYLAAEIAVQLGDVGLAVPDYVLVARSQPGEAQGLAAMSALQSLGWLASPLPSAYPGATAP